MIIFKWTTYHQCYHFSQQRQRYNWNQVKSLRDCCLRSIIRLTLLLLLMFRILEMSRINIGCLMTKKYLRKTFRRTISAKYSQRKSILLSPRSIKRSSFGIRSVNLSLHPNHTTNMKEKETEVTEAIGEEIMETRRSTVLRETMIRGEIARGRDQKSTNRGNTRSRTMRDNWDEWW